MSLLQPPNYTITLWRWIWDCLYGRPPGRPYRPAFGVFIRSRIFIIAVWIFFITAGSLSAGEDLCYICHNPPLLKDNRSCAVWADHGHPINIRPSKKIVIPDDFPLNDRGEIICLTCHEIHEEFPKNSPDKNPRSFSRKIYLRHNNVNSSLCKECHIRETATQLKPDLEKAQYNFVVDESFELEEDISRSGLKIRFNHPVDIASMRIPRRLMEAGGKIGSEKDQIICQTCHRMHQAKGTPLLAVDNERSFLCGICHGAMYARDRAGASKKGTHPVNVKPSTAVLSEDILLRGGRKNIHGEIFCLTCHAVHLAETKKTLLLKENLQSSFCVECHKEKMRSLQQTKHDIGKLFPQSQNIQQQTPRQSGACGTCHLAHNGTGAKMWARPIEKQEEAISDLCKSCHAAGKMAENRLVGNHTHPVGIGLDKLKEDAPRYSWLPLFSEYGITEGKGNLTCATCHNTHQWEPDYEIAPPDALTAEGDETTSFLRIKDTGSKLCLVCHKKQRLVEQTVHDTRIDLYSLGKAVPLRLDMDGKPTRSPPSGICRACHIPHRAQSVRLWNRELGPGNDPFSRICVSCHRDGFIASEKQTGTISHPNNVLFSAPFPIKLPLYNKQFVKAENGRIFCITCHNIHRWDPDVATAGDGTRKEGTPGDSFLRIAANNREKSLCDDCHIDQQWIKNTDHDLAVTAPEETDDNGRTPLQAGICASCHAVHNAPSQLVLWGRELGGEKDKIAAMCNSCHHTGGSAAKKVLGANSHPVGISTFTILDSIKSTSLPIFNDKYKRIYQSGEKLAPIFYADDPESKAKVEIVKSYFRASRKKYKNARSELPGLKRELEKFIDEFEQKEETINRQIKEREAIRKKINETREKHKRLEFKLQLLRVKERLMNRTIRGSRKGSGISNKSYKRLTARMEAVEKSYKKAEEYLVELYERNKKFNHELLEDENWNEEALKKADSMKKKYVKLVETYKGTQRKLNDLISKIQGEKTTRRVDITRIKNLDQVFKNKSLMDSLTKQDLVRKLFKLRKRYSDMIRRMRELKRKIKKMISQASGKPSSGEEELSDKEEKTPLQIARENLDLEYHIAKSFDDSDIESLEDIGQQFQGKMFCNTCHNPHQWNPRKNDFGPGKAVEGGSADSFLRIANNSGSSLCIDCHKKMEVVEGTDHDLRVSAPEEVNAIAQTAGSGGLCGSCHMAHNSAGPTVLWAKQVPSDNDKDMISLLCQTCHNQKGCASAKGIGNNSHIVNVEIPRPKEFERKKRKHTKSESPKRKGKLPSEKTKIKAGNKEQVKSPLSAEKNNDQWDIKKMSPYPLFTYEGNRDDENGKLFCSTCHDVHQWKPGHKEKGRNIPLEGTLADSFLRDDNLTRPLLCLNCHPDKTSVLGTKHDLVVGAPQEKNIIARTAKQSGTCGVCHLVHNAATQNNLWARSFGPGVLEKWNPRLAVKDNKSVRMCTGCHSRKGLASQSIPEAGLHFNRMYIIQKEVKDFLENPRFPYFDYVYSVMGKRLGISEIYRNEAPPKFPLYNFEGKSSPSGIISCPTCHDVHTWSVKKEVMDTGGNGDFSTSFLRDDVAGGLCSDCHGYDSIYLFAYYHKKRGGKTEGVAANNPHWKSKSTALKKSCRDCHNNKITMQEKHPVNVTLAARKKKIKLPVLSENFPLAEGKLDCHTCHKGKIQKKVGMRAFNPNFLQGAFYTAFWKKEYKKRTLAEIKSSSGKGSFGGGYGMSGMRGSDSRPSSPALPPGVSAVEKHRDESSSNKNETTFPGPTSHLGRSYISPAGMMFFYDWKELIIAPWQSLIRLVNNAFERTVREIGIIQVENHFRDVVTEIFARFETGQWETVDSVNPAVISDNKQASNQSSEVSFPLVASNVPGEKKTRSSSRRSYQTPYFQEKGQQGKPKEGKVKRRKKRPETKKDEKIQDKNIPDKFGPPGYTPKASKFIKRKRSGGLRTGPRKHMIPKVTEEMLRARKKRRIKRKKKKEVKKQVKKKVVPRKKFVEPGTPTALGLALWTSNDAVLFNPNRYSLCYECHVMAEYKQFNPHTNQINKDDTLNTEMCILCHIQIPDRKTVDESKFFLRDKMGKYCLGCHIGFTKGHPRGNTHYGRDIPDMYWKRIKKLISSAIVYVPTEDNKLVCPSCHNPHEKGVILSKMADRGADERGRLRFDGNETCNACHKSSYAPTTPQSLF